MKSKEKQTVPPYKTLTGEQLQNLRNECNRQIAQSVHEYERTTGIKILAISDLFGEFEIRVQNIL